MARRNLQFTYAVDKDKNMDFIHSWADKAVKGTVVNRTRRVARNKITFFGVKYKGGGQGVPEKN